MKQAILVLGLNLLVLHLSAQCFQLGGDIDGVRAGDLSGYSVSISGGGTRVAIGAPGYDGLLNNLSNIGHVRVLDWTGLTWSQQASIVGVNAGEQVNGASWSANPVALSADGQRVIIGSPYSDVTGNNRGLMRVFREVSPGNWSILGAAVTGPADNDFFGSSVAISADGSRVAIGAPYNDEGPGSNAGSVRVYEWISPNWTLIGNIWGAAAGDLSGASVSLSADGNRLAIGAAYHDSTTADWGHVRVFDYNGSSWIRIGGEMGGEGFNNKFGSSVSLSATGTRVAIGAPGYNNSRGRVQVYECTWNTGPMTWTWNKVLGVLGDIDGTASFDYLGASVSLSGDGRRVAAGAYSYDPPGKSNGGRARVYEERPTGWLPVCLNAANPNVLDAEAANDQFGRSVSLSQDGTIVAIGGPFNDGSGSDAGHVRVFGDLVLLPIRLIYFSARATTGTNVELDWQTASETNNDYFTIQRSVTGREWEDVVEVDGAGNSVGLRAYSAVDFNGYFGTSYYRLMQTDYDGSTTYSDMAAVFITGSNKPIIYPNPTTDKITVRGGKENLGEFVIHDQLGRDITSMVTIYPGPNDDSVIVDLSALPGGAYYYRSAGMSQQIIKL